MTIKQDELFSMWYLSPESKSQFEIDIPIACIIESDKYHKQMMS